ncbi:MAG TPA: Co2+/Mg2+ efflux protein ApaG [Polyangiaceae bacterium]
MPNPEAVTRGIRVRVKTEFAPTHSDPRRHRWFFSYTIRISNEGPETVQLLNRSWIITNAEGHVEQVQGAGVVGEQPVLEPGRAFEYTSGCPLQTPFGSMHGTYEMATQEGERFEVAIPPFVLRLPGSMN